MSKLEKILGTAGKGIAGALIILPVLWSVRLSYGLCQIDASVKKVCIKSELSRVADKNSDGALSLDEMREYAKLLKEYNLD